MTLPRPRPPLQALTCAAPWPPAAAVNYCPANPSEDSHTGACLVGTIAMDSMPPGACAMQWEVRQACRAAARVPSRLPLPSQLRCRSPPLAASKRAPRAGGRGKVQLHSSARARPRHSHHCGCGRLPARPCRHCSCMPGGGLAGAGWMPPSTLLPPWRLPSCPPAIPVTARANLTVPGYRQHLGQVGGLHGGAAAAAAAVQAEPWMRPPACQPCPPALAQPFRLWPCSPARPCWARTTCAPTSAPTRCAQTTAGCWARSRSARAAGRAGAQPWRAPPRHLLRAAC